VEAVFYIVRRRNKEDLAEAGRGRPARPCEGLPRANQKTEARTATRITVYGYYGVLLRGILKKGGRLMPFFLCLENKLRYSSGPGHLVSFQSKRLPLNPLTSNTSIILTSTIPLPPPPPNRKPPESRVAPLSLFSLIKQLCPGKVGSSHTPPYRPDFPALTPPRLLIPEACTMEANRCPRNI
jgi:hypothetical protein